MWYFVSRGTILKYINTHKNQIILIGVLLFVSFIVSIPMYAGGLPSGDDWLFHLLRIEGLKDALQSGQVPVRINPLFFNGYGYAVSLFYPDLFLYIPALLRLGGLNLIASYDIFIALLSMATFIAAYYCGKGISKSRYTGIIIAVVYCLSQYHLQNIYTRFALGEVQAFIYLPFIVYGLYNFIYETFDKPYLFVVGFTGLIYCHLISAVLAFIVSLFIMIFGLRHIVKDSKKIPKLLLAALFTVGLTCAFWLPMLEQMTTNKFSFELEYWSTLQDMAADFGHIFMISYKIGYGYCSIGVELFILCALRLLLIRPGKSAGPEDRKKIKIADGALIVGFVLVFAASNLFPWGYMPAFMKNIQFPWRLFSLATLLFSVAIGIIFGAIFPRKKYIGMALILIVMTASAVSTLQHSVTYAELPKYDEVRNTYPDTGYQYVPLGLDGSILKELPSEVSTDSGENLRYERNGVKLTIEYPSAGNYINVPLIFYKGYTAKAIDGAGMEYALPIVYGKDKNIQIACSTVTAPCTIIVDYTGTTAQDVSFALSLTMCFFIIAVVLRRQHRLSRRIGEQRVLKR